MLTNGHRVFFPTSETVDSTENVTSTVVAEVALTWGGVERAVVFVFTVGLIFRSELDFLLARLLPSPIFAFGSLSSLSNSSFVEPEEEGSVRGRLNNSNGFTWETRLSVSNAAIAGPRIGVGSGSLGFDEA